MVAPAAEAEAAGFVTTSVIEDDFFRFGLEADADATDGELELPFVIAFEFELIPELFALAAVILCLALLWTRNPKTRGTYADSCDGRSGTRLLKVMRNRCAKVVPNDAPSTWCSLPILDSPFLIRMYAGGWYTFWHLGQNNLKWSRPHSS